MRIQSLTERMTTWPHTCPHAHAHTHPLCAADAAGTGDVFFYDLSVRCLLSLSLSLSLSLTHSLTLSLSLPVCLN